MKTSPSAAAAAAATQASPTAHDAAGEEFKEDSKAVGGQVPWAPRIFEAAPPDFSQYTSGAFLVSEAAGHQPFASVFP